MLPRMFQLADLPTALGAKVVSPAPKKDDPIAAFEQGEHLQCGTVLSHRQMNPLNQAGALAKWVSGELFAAFAGRPDDGSFEAKAKAWADIRSLTEQQVAFDKTSAIFRNSVEKDYDLPWGRALGWETATPACTAKARTAKRDLDPPFNAQRVVEQNAKAAHLAEIMALKQQYRKMVRKA